MIINAENAVAGRLASSVAKQLLEGKKIIIINSEKSIITGRPEEIKGKYLEKRARGSAHHGPFLPRKPDLLLRRIIRGMLPYKTPRGRNAMKRLKIFIGFPDNLSGKHIMVSEYSDKEIRTRYITIGKLSKSIGYNN